MEHNDELRMAWEFIEHTGTSLFLTGKAGTGKTTFLRELKARSPKRLVVVAPTGIAAINAGGVTIHSFFQLPLSPFVPGASFTKSDRRYQIGKTKRQIIASMDLLVIDEVSMVRADTLDAIDDVLRRFRDRGKPFGGVQLLLIGDLQQLAPVVTPAEEGLIGRYYATPYFFSANSLRGLDYQMIELQKVYRQQDDSFLQLLAHIRNNTADDSVLAALNRRYKPAFIPEESEHYVRLVTHNHQAAMINNQCLARLAGAPFTLKATVKGKFPETSYPLDVLLTLKPGAQVMMVKNAKDKSYYNGMLGEVVGYDGKVVSVRSHDNGQIISVAPDQWTNSRYDLNPTTKEITEQIEGTFTQYPLRPAYAITIHKSQGLTFEHVIIDASRAFSHGQTYVALSRCKTLEGIVLSEPLTRAAIITDKAVDSFTAEQETHRPTPEKLRGLTLQYAVRLLDELFDLEPLAIAAEGVQRVLAEHFYQIESRLIAGYQRQVAILRGMKDISRRFHEQYTAMLSHGTPLADAALQERIHKGAAYFLTQLQPVIELADATDVTTGNRIVADKLDNRFADMDGQLTLKCPLLVAYANTANTFTTADYLRRKARILLGGRAEEPAETAKGKAQTKKDKMPAAAKPAAAKPEPDTQPRKAATKVTRSTFDITLDFFTRGFTTAQIAEKREFAVSTILSHAAKLIKDGRLTVEQVIPKDRLDIIRLYLRHIGAAFNYAAAKAFFEGKASIEEVMMIRRLDAKK